MNTLKQTEESLAGHVQGELPSAETKESFYIQRTKKEI